MSIQFWGDAYIIPFYQQHKTHFPNQVDYNKKILSAVQEYVTKGKFIQVQKYMCLCC